MLRRILTVGNSMFTIHTGVDDLPSGEGEIRASRCSFAPGGAGALVSVALSRGGLDSVLCSKLGGDMNGSLIRQTISDAGVDTRFISIDTRRKTSTVIIASDTEGKMSKMRYEGAISSFSSDDIEDAFTCYPDYSYICGDMAIPRIEDALEFSKQQDIPVFYDARKNSGFRFNKENMPVIEMLIVGPKEVEQLSGIAPLDIQTCFDAVIKLSVQIKAKYFAVDLGSRGSAIYDGKTMQVERTYTDPADIADPSKLSAAFSSALICDYLSSHDAMSAIRHGEAARAYCASKDGTVSAFPTKEELENYIIRQGIGKDD